ncbi:MAG: hypothetical protein C4521_01895 [Actinobacteria bacterium]|nr:MAG: hypothetical protein C4521_01895 [Actinomycetota bacterium]
MVFYAMALEPAEALALVEGLTPTRVWQAGLSPATPIVEEYEIERTGARVQIGYDSFDPSTRVPVGAWLYR